MFHAQDDFRLNTQIVVGQLIVGSAHCARQRVLNRQNTSLRIAAVDSIEDALEVDAGQADSIKSEVIAQRLFRVGPGLALKGDN